MKSNPTTLFKLFLLIFFFNTPGLALPLLDRPYPLPASFEGIITFYPDHENTNTKRSYWMIPSTARIIRNPSGKLAFGLVHSGVSSFDPDGINALLNITIQPYVDDATIQRAKRLIEEADAKEGATSSFVFIAPTETTARLLIGGQYVDFRKGATDEPGTKDVSVVKGGSVEAGIPFQVKIDKSFDVRALTQAGGDNTSTLGVLYSMKYKGIGDRVHVRITAKFTETYEHFKASVRASGWFGLARASASTEWQKLKSEDAVIIKILQGTEAQVDSILPKDIIQKLMEALVARTGFFARTLKPNGISNAPGGGGLWGWSFSASGGFESTDEQRELIIEIDNQYTRDQEIVFGMSFPSGGDELKSYVKNVTNTDKPYPTSDDFNKILEQHRKCRASNIEALRRLLSERTINQELYDKLIENALTKGCYVDYSTDNIARIMTPLVSKDIRHAHTRNRKNREIDKSNPDLIRTNQASPASIKVENLPISTLLEFIDMK